MRDEENERWFFERWLKEVKNLPPTMTLVRHPNGDYREHSIQELWQAWKARAELL